MAEDLDDGEFWLPSQFLADEDTLMERKSLSSNCYKNKLTEFPYGFDSYGSSTALSSPVESVVSSMETESDEEDYLAGLTRQMTQSMLLEHEKVTISPAFGTESYSKGWGVAVSPQSTLCGNWLACSAKSSRGSPNGHSMVSSPPLTPVNEKNDAWDLLSAVAGQVGKMKVNEQRLNRNHGQGLLGPPRNPLPITAPVKNPNLNLYPNQALTHQQFQINQYQHLKNQQLMKNWCPTVWGKQSKVTGFQSHPHQLQNRVTGVYNNGRSSRPLGLSSSAWPPLTQHQQAGSGMRAVFLEGSTTRKESCGTGVFLPRQVGNTSDSRRKPACSTVLLPARVVQALNLNFDDFAAYPRFNGGFAPEHVDRFTDVHTTRNNPLLTQQNRHLRQPAMSLDNHLPPDWTY